LREYSEPGDFGGICTPIVRGSAMGSIGGRPLKVGLYLPTFDQPWVQTPAPRWRDLLVAACRAEAVGFDSVWVPDHLLIRDDGERLGVWEGWSLLAALAASTERVELGTLVACTAFRNPALLAKMADTVDEISGGRLTLGLGAGWHEPEFQAFGYPFDHRVSRFEEAVTIIHGLLKHGQIDFEGMYYQARDCELRPRGPRPAGPPIMIGASGARVLGLTARFADIWNRDFDKVNPELEPFSPEDFAAWQSRVDAACIGVGRDPATLERTAAVLIDLPIAPGREGWDALTGSPEELADGLRNYASAGFTHVQIWLEPSTIAGIEAFAPVLELLDGG
jgi:alkanesulfonate monooxygenase SsuD/methylene tetrahydromethanopterin reductase-like flavin-dependent oxidoreductase (luciferase family)